MGAGGRLHVPYWGRGNGKEQTCQDLVSWNHECVGSKVVAPGPDPPHGAFMSVPLVGLLSLSMIWISA